MYLDELRSDIANILGAVCVYPSEKMLLYRTAWIDRRSVTENSFPYLREYKSLSFEIGSTLEINIVSSCSSTPYREDDNVWSNFFRYEMRMPCGTPVLN